MQRGIIGKKKLIFIKKYCLNGKYCLILEPNNFAKIEKLVFVKMKFIDEIDDLSRISACKEEISFIPFMKEFVVRAAGFLNIERINVWLLDRERNAIFSIAEYDKRDGEFSHSYWIYEKDVPHYFERLKKDKIILATDIHTHPATYEFSDNYAKQYDVISLMDVPLRLNGELAGVMCFEKTGKEPKEFNEQEQTFAIALAQLALAHIENAKRINLQKKLEEMLKQKELLIKELNHRVKNNFSVLVSLLRISKDNIKKNKEEVFEAIEQQMFSMIKVHEMLIESGQHEHIDLSEYLQKLAEEFHSSYNDIRNNLKFIIDEQKFFVSIKNAVNLGLIVTEIFLNALKYCVLKNAGVFELNMKVVSDSEAEIVLGDNCNDFDFESVYKKQMSLGLSIIKDLTESAGFEIVFPTKGCSKYKIVIKK